MDKTIKRDNWTNEEVISIVRGLLIVPIGNEDGEAILPYNGAIGAVIETFEDFKRDPSDPKEYSAMAYCPETDEVVHVGTMPPR